MLSPPTESEPPAKRGKGGGLGSARPGKRPPSILTQEAIGRQQPEIGVPRELFVLVHKVQLVVRVGQLVALAVALGRGHGRRREGAGGEGGRREAGERAGAGWPRRRREGGVAEESARPAFIRRLRRRPAATDEAKRRRVGFLPRAGEGAVDTRATVLPHPRQSGHPKGREGGGATAAPPRVSTLREVRREAAAGDEESGR